MLPYVMPKNSNLAYAPKKPEVSREEKPKVQIKQYVRPRAVTRRRMAQKTTAIMLYIILLCAALIYGKVKLTEENKALEDTKSQYQELKSDYTRLESAVGQLASLKNIEEKAKEAGMSEVKSSQIVNIVVSNDNEVEVADKSESILSKISDWFTQIKEYIVG